ncbi:MAG: hypothetical protein HY553_08925, partial [Elusimicrobia bacterium]|nr:hypothetical protein [Elusimicrobiota bacterium]
AQPLAPAAPATPPGLLLSVAAAYRTTLVALAAPYTSRGAAASLIDGRGEVMKARARGIAGELNDGIAHEKALLLDSGAGPLPVPLAKPQEQPAVAVDRKGVEHPLSYKPDRKPESLVRAGWRFATGLPDRIRRVRAFMSRTRELAESVTDDDLKWSLYRLEPLANQEGILRTDNQPLVNPWKNRDKIKQLSPADFDGASLDRVSIMKAFKAAMDLEEPTLQYQYAFAQSLHNRLPRMSHFLGTTFQERVLQVALKGKAGQMAIWSNEEVRHGPILEKVYNATRDESLPPLKQQGAAPRLPRFGTDYVARSGMSNRSLAELAAGVAYTTIKANAKPGSPTDLVMDGVWRDEVYHYVIMSALNKFVFGHHSRLKRLTLIFRHDLDFRPKQPIDGVKHFRPGISPLTLFEFAYALNTIDERVDRYLRGLDPAEARRVIGPYYKTDADIRAAVDRGEHSWTRLFPMEVNPDLTASDMERLARRMPESFSTERRAVSEPDLQAILDDYRKNSLYNPKYWLRKKGFREEGPAELRRELPGSPGTDIRLDFLKGGVLARLTRGGEPLWVDWLDRMSLREIGELMNAESAEVVPVLERRLPDLAPAELLKRLSNSPAYQKAPVRLIPTAP